MVEQIIDYEDELQIEDDFDYVSDNDDDDDDNELSYHHKVPGILDNLDWNDMTDMIRSMDSEPGMNLVARQQARHHKKNILSIRRKLVKEKLIMRTIYKGSSLYICSASEFQQKSSEYIKQTGIYIFISNVNPVNPAVSQTCLKDIVKQVEITLKDLLCSKSITDRQYILMYPSLSCVQLNYLYFVPDTSKEEKPLHPIIICKNGPTMNITRYLNRLLWSMFNQITGCKTYSNGADIVYDLEQYVKNDYLQETTHFATFNINNICTRFPHEMAIKALEKFLHSHRSELEIVVEGLSNETIIQLVRLVLQNQFFIYQNKLYRQIHGSASGSLLTMPLACIYLFYGQSSSLINTLINNKNELFGRCRDDIFLTWNDSKDTFLTLFNEIMIYEQHPTISLPTATIESSIHLLDLELSNHQGHLHTKIYHDSTNDDYDLPNKFEYHTCQPSRLLKAALKHAVQCCLNENDYHNEYRHLRLSHLIRGFSPNFIDKCTTEFYNELGIETKFNHFLFNIIPYKTLRQHVLENYEQQIALKKQQEQNKKQNIIRIPYPNHWDIDMVADMKNNILNILKDHMNDIEFEFVPRPQTPLTKYDYLIDKRPPLRLLTLSDTDKHKERHH